MNNSHLNGIDQDTHGTCKSVLNANTLQEVVEDLERMHFIPGFTAPNDNDRKNDRPHDDTLDARLRRVRHLLPFAPNPNLFFDHLYSHIPYNSIETVFNHTHIYGNIQNHNPLYILYDLDDTSRWEAFHLYFESDNDGIEDISGPNLDGKRPKQKDNNANDRVIAGSSLESLHIIDRIDSEVVVSPPMKRSLRLSITSRLRNELKESIILYRTKLGHDTHFVQNKAVIDVLEEYLSLLESRNHLSFEYDTYVHNRHHSDDRTTSMAELADKMYAKHPLSSEMEEMKAMRLKWNTYYLIEEEYRKRFAAVCANHDDRTTFSGFPIHVSSPTCEKYRTYVLSLPQVLAALNIPTSRISFTIVNRVYPLPGGATSVWLFFGVRIPLTNL